MSGKYIFFDIDGTLWDHKMQIPDSTREALRLLKANGHKIFISSGRSRANIHSDDLDSLGFDGILCACGNHIEVDGTIIYERILEEDLVKRTIEVTTRAGMPVVLEGPDYHWISEEGFDPDPFVDYLWESLGERGLPMRGYEPGMRLNKFSADHFEDTDYDYVKAELGPYYDILEHDGMVIECVPKGSSKATGIQWLMDHDGIALEDTYAVGDSVNDHDMLSFVGHGIAMGNASPSTKDIAEYVTSDIHEDGIYHAMKHYGLI